MEAPETAAHMAETSDMGDTHAVGETATSKMGDIYAAVSEPVTSDMGDTYAAETHAVMDDAPISADACVSEAVAVPAIKYSPAGIVVIAKVIRACRGTAVSRIVHRPRGTGVLLRRSRLRASECSHGQPNATSYQDRFNREFAAGHRSLLWGFAPQFIAKWDLGWICGAASSQAAPRYWQKFLPGS